MAKARILAVLIIGVMLLAALAPGHGVLASVASPPDTPMNYSPDNATEEIGPLHTFMFLYTDNETPVVNAHLQIQRSDAEPPLATDGSYDKPLWDSGLVELHSWSIPVGLLEYGQKYWWHVRVQDDTGAWSAWSVQTWFKVMANSPPNQPTNLKPADGEKDVAVSPILNASDFTDPDTTTSSGSDQLKESLTASQWQIAKEGENQKNADGSYKTTTLGGSYTASTIAFVAATRKITDSANGLAIFNTGDTISIAGSTSNNGVYTVAVGNVSGEIVVSESLKNESAGASVSVNSVTTTNMTSFVVPDSKLAASTRYYWHVRYQDNHGNWSAYSLETSFTTKSVSALVASFSADKTEVIGGQDLVTFTDNSTPAGEIDRWSWDFGDGTTENWTSDERPSNGQITHTYTATGSKTVKLTVYNAATTAGVVKTLVIVVHAKPVASFTMTPAAKAGKEIAITDDSNPTEDITSWEWRFDDGSPVETWTERPENGEFTHVFDKAGTHTVSLTVTGALGESYYSKEITVTGGGGFRFGLWMIGAAVAAVVVLAGVFYLVRGRKAK